jgi:hypothetical protein
VEDFLMNNPKENKLKPIFDALQGTVDYGKIRLVLEYKKNKN